MKNFDTPLDEAGVQHLVVRIDTPVRSVRDQAVVHPKHPEVRASDLLKPDEEWTAQDLRDYVIRQIELHHGLFPRTPQREVSIFARFMKDWPQAPAIARYAFEVCDGMWNGSPVSINRFCKNSDPYFAQVIVTRLSSTPLPLR